MELLESDSYQINVRQDKERIRCIQARLLLDNLQAQLALLAGFRNNMTKKGALVWRDAIGPSQDLTTRRQNAEKILAHAVNKHDVVREFVESDLFSMAIEFNSPVRVASDQATHPDNLHTAFPMMGDTRFTSLVQYADSFEDIIKSDQEL